MIQRTIFAVLILFTFITTTNHAQTTNTLAPLYNFPQADFSQYPTVNAIETATIPEADRYDIARRLRGVTVSATPEPQAWSVGDVKAFSVIDTSRNETRLISAELIVIGEHIYVWVESGKSVDLTSAQVFAQRFDAEIYDQTRALWGDEPNPGIDGDSRIFALFSTGINPATGAYFTSQHTYPQAIVPTSNEHEMLIFNLGAIGPKLDTPFVISTAAHEFQHMIRHHMDLNEATWLDEGFSMFTEQYLGLDSKLSLAAAFASSPATQLNDWGKGGGVSAQYGAAMMFIAYFHSRYGDSALQTVSSHPLTGLEAFNASLTALNEPDIDLFFADWALANILHRPELGLGYDVTLWPDLQPSLALMNVDSYPHTFERRLSQYATDFYTYTGLNAGDTLTVTVEANPFVPLVPIIPASGQWVLYSNKGDESNTRLTREFDLTGVTSATLTYKVWYDLEELWDFAYVSISADGGQTWDVLTTPNMTDANPNGRSFATGYTGTTPVWVEESISLSDYAGQNVLIRFETVTDDAVTGAGLALDDIAIAEIGYQSDFEQDAAGWQFEGWARIDNRLPQSAWVQAVQTVGDDVFIDRWRLSGDQPDANQFTVTLVDGADSVTVALSPFAPQTTLAMRYRISADVE